MENTNELHSSSSELNDNFIGVHKVVGKVNKHTIKGYKLVRDMGENFYSIVTGFFRYKLGRLSSKDPYWNLYKPTPSFCEELVNKVTIFKSIKDIHNYYPHLSQNPHTCILEFEIGGELIELESSNAYSKNITIFAGTEIVSMKRISNEVHKTT